MGLGTDGGPPSGDRTGEHGPPGPVAVIQCAGCGAVTPLPAPPGWLVARRADGTGRPHRYGACPSCMATRYTFPADDPPPPDTELLPR
jgi:hypothetical protein